MKEIVDNDISEAEGTLLQGQYNGTPHQYRFIASSATLGRQRLQKSLCEI